MKTKFFRSNLVLFHAYVACNQSFFQKGTLGRGKIAANWGRQLVKSFIFNGLVF